MVLSISQNRVLFSVPLCQYCHKQLEKIECPKENGNGEYSMNIHEVISVILWFISLFVASYKKRLKEHKFKITCINEDCIGYLDGCMVNKYRLIWQYLLKKRDVNM